MSLMKQIEADIITAMKARESATLTLLRGLKAELKNFQISGGTRDEEMKEQDVIAVLSSAAKRRRDSIEQYQAGGRQDLVDIETRELEFIQKYLPAQMSEDEIRKIIVEAVANLGLSSPAEIGALMKEIMPKFKGKADGKLVNQIARELLAQANSNK